MLKTGLLAVILCGMLGCTTGVGQTDTAATTVDGNPLTPAPTGSSLDKDALTPAPTGTTTGRFKIAFTENDVVTEKALTIESNEMMVLNLEHPDMDMADSLAQDAAGWGQDRFRYHILKDTRYEFCFDANLEGDHVLALKNTAEETVLSLREQTGADQGRDCQMVDLKAGFYDCLLTHSGQGSSAQAQPLFIWVSDTEAEHKRVLVSSDCPDCNLYQANLAGFNLSHRNLKGADLTDANLTDVNLTQTDLSRAIWPNGIMCKAPSIGQCQQD